MEITQLERIAKQVRRDIIRMVHGCQSGHPGGSLGATDIVTALYFDQMQINPEQFRMDGVGEDMFFLSNGHISPMLYSIMAHRGYFPVGELATFRRLGSRLQGQLCREKPGGRYRRHRGARRRAEAAQIRGLRRYDGEIRRSDRLEALFHPHRGILLRPGRRADAQSGGRHSRDGG